MSYLAFWKRGRWQLTGCETDKNTGERSLCAPARVVSPNSARGSGATSPPILLLCPAPWPTSLRDGHLSTTASGAWDRGTLRFRASRRHPEFVVGTSTGSCVVGVKPRLSQSVWEANSVNRKPPAQATTATSWPGIHSTKGETYQSHGGRQRRLLR